MMKGLLGMFQPQQSQFQTLLGEYYDPSAARMKWFGGTLQGLGAGLASGRPGAWAEGLASGGGQALGEYQREALLGHQMQLAQDERDYRRQQDEEADERWQMEWDYNVGRQNKADAWTNTQNQAWLEDRQREEDMRLGQQNAVEGFAQDFTAQGGDLFSPEMQGWLRGQGIAGVDPQDTQRYDRMQPFMAAQDYGGAFQQMTAEQAAPLSPTDDMREYQMAVQQGYTGTFQQYMIDMRRAGATNIDARQMGNIPPGYRVEYDEQGRPLQMVPIAGSPAAQEAASAASAAENRAQNNRRSSDIVIEDINRSLELLETATIPATGMIGSVASNIPGTAAHDIGQLVLGIRANIGFDRLQRMRDESPTGGALGQVAVQEIQALQATLGSLAQSQTEEQFRENLIRLRELYLDTIHGPGNRPAPEPPQTSAPRVRQYNPQTGRIE
jgi:hypothetical protein